MASYTWAVSLVRRWGEAENGEVFEVALRPHLLDELRRRWPPLGLACHIDQPPGPIVARIGLSDSWVIVPDDEESGDHPPPLAWDQLEQSLTVFTAHRLARLVAVHAAAFAWNGRCIMVPASSGGGKSSLTVAAATAGATVLTDEYVLLDPATGWATGWHRPVRILRHDGGVDRLHLAERQDPMPVCVLALVRHAPDADDVFTPIGPGEAVGQLLAHTLCARHRPDDAFDAAVAVARTATSISGTRSEAATAITALRRLVERGAGPERQP